MILYTNECNNVANVDRTSELELTGNSKLKYYILLNVDCSVLYIRAINGTYSYALHAKNRYRGISIENIIVTEGNEVELDSDISATFCPDEEGNYMPNTASLVTSNDMLSVSGEYYLTSESNLRAFSNNFSSKQNDALVVKDSFSIEGNKILLIDEDLLEKIYLFQLGITCII